MKKIKSIDVLNFKVFRHREFFDLDGKNLLIYGTNGSGKSSLFWALYTFLQSASKQKDEVERYFDPENERNLRNIFSKPTDQSFIKVTFIDENKVETKYEIGATIRVNPDFNAVNGTDVVGDFLSGETKNTNDTYIKTYTMNTIGVPDVKIADAASDFINYRLLLNFYNASHRDKTDLIYVFERDIFPFFNNDEGESLAENFYFLIENPPRVQREVRLELEKAKSPPAERLLESTIKEINEKYEIQRKKFNLDLDKLFNELNLEGNKFLKKHFTNDVEKFKFEISFFSETVKDKGTGSNKLEIADLRIDEFGLASNPYITLNVWQKDIAGEQKDIWRPHSFLNEAKLTQLALSIRLAALKLKLQKAPSIIQTLVVDDLLISLDMSNRLIVLEIILKEFIDYQLIILTHDKGFFDLVNLKTKLDDKKWIKLEFYDTDTEGNPTIRISEDYLSRAVKYKDDNLFDLAAVMLRKKAENILQIYLDPDLKQLSVFDTKDTLSVFLSKAKKHPYNDPYTKFLDFIQKNRISVADLENYEIKNTSLKESVTGEKITEMIGFLQKLLEQSKTQLQWLKDSEELRITLKKIIDDMEDLSSRVLNPGSHSSTAAMYKQEIEEAVNLIKDANKKLGLA